MKRRRSSGKVLLLASVASMIDQFNMPNIQLLQNMGYEVHVACNFQEGNTCDAAHIQVFLDRLQKQGIQAHQWDCPRNIHAACGCIKAYKQLWKLTENEQYDMFHCHSPIGGVLARCVAHFRNIPVVYTAHGFHFYQGAPVKNWLLYYPVEKLLANWTDVLITVNREDDRFAKRNLRAGSVCRIPGVGIDTARFASSDRNLRKAFRMQNRIPLNAVLLLSVGELNEGKNHRVVLDALASLKDRNVYYLICGQGILQEQLLRYAAGLGIAGQIRMPGYVEDVAAVYLASDFFIFPSRREGMPVALMEAIAAGLPCIVSDIRGNRELITERELRFHPEHPEELAEILTGLRADKNRCRMYGSRNRRRSLNHDLTVVVKRMEKIYGELLDERPG